MPVPPPAASCMAFAEVDTPALIVDLDAYERNLATMAAMARRLGVRLRPHAKTHKSPEIALAQMALGAVGVCCQKVGEAEILVAGGVGDVLIANEVIGARKLARLAELSKRATISVCVDNAQGVRQLALAAAAGDVRIDCLVEIDAGGRRCGVVPGEPAADLARLVAREKHLRFAGIQAYHGSAQHLRTVAERRGAIDRAGEGVAASLSALKGAGLAAEVVSGAGTGTFELEATSGLWTEIQPGSYVFMDADYARNLQEDGRPVDGFVHALFVLATVMSSNGSDRAVVDAGHKALSNDSGFPGIVGLAGAAYHRPSDEHGVLDLTACNARPGIGDRLLLIPGHCDPTVNLHDWYVGVRGLGTPAAVVERVWQVAARGALF